MIYRYCANRIPDITAFRQTVSNMGGRVVFNPVFYNGFYQCWFDMDEKLELDETMTFTMLQCGVQIYVPVKVETY